MTAPGRDVLGVLMWAQNASGLGLARDVEIQAAAHNVGSRVGHGTTPELLPLCIGGGHVCVSAIRVQVSKAGRYQDGHRVRAEQRLRGAHGASHTFDVRDGCHDLTDEVDHASRLGSPLDGQQCTHWSVSGWLETRIEILEQ